MQPRHLLPRPPAPILLEPHLVVIDSEVHLLYTRQRHEYEDHAACGDGGAVAQPCAAEVAGEEGGEGEGQREGLEDGGPGVEAAIG